MRYENYLIVFITIFKYSRTENSVPIIQCSEANVDYAGFPECRMENSCIVTNLNINNINSIDRTVHDYKCLIFTESSIPEIPSNIFMTLKSSITHLYAKKVNINELRRISFPLPQKLESVDLSWNLIEILNETIFYDAPNLILLNLSHNLIRSFSPNVFEKLDSLQVLDMSFNQITTIPHDLFLPLINLVELNLRYNRLQLRFGLFPENIKILDLSHNDLEIQQKFKIFSLLKNLETLLLHGNRIGNVDGSIFNSNLRSLGLTDNLFACNILADIILTMKARNVSALIEYSVADTSNIEGIQCYE